LATWPLSGTAAQLDAIAAVGSGQGASGKKSATGQDVEVWVALGTKSPRPVHVGFVSK